MYEAVCTVYSGFAFGLSDRIPTCHRTQYKSILEDTDCLHALSRADAVQRSIYIREAEYIDSVQKGILEISNREDPFDVFICYKESDEDGKRTQDSVIAQDLYYQLTQEGFKVFFSRITLESKLGTEYEPYIFAALNSAKVMVVVGTKAEYFNAVWVKNEWSRYLMLMQEDKRRTLIPAYKNMDPYDLPDALSMFQAQDMSKLGFMQDLIRGINKITENDEPAKKSVSTESPASAVSGSVSSLLKRASLFLEDGDWSSAAEYCNKVLDMDPECAQAYFYMILAELNIYGENEAGSVFEDEVEDFYYDHEKYKNGIGELNFYKKAYRYADSEFKKKLEYYHKQSVYGVANERLHRASTAAEYQKAKDAFGHEDIRGFKDVEQKIAECDERALECDYSKAEKIFEEAHSSSEYAQAAQLFGKLGDYKDSKEKVKECENSALECDYLDAVRAFDKAHTPAEFAQVAQLFEALGDYRDSKEKVKECENGVLEYDYNRAAEALRKAETNDEFTEAERLFKKLGDYKDSKEQAQECEKKKRFHKFSIICDRLDAVVIEKGHIGKNKYAVEKLQQLKKDFEECKYEGYQEKIAECDRKIALAAKMNTKARWKKLSLIAAAVVLAVATPTVILPSVKYMNAVKLMEEGNYVEASSLFSDLKNYKDSKNKKIEALAIIREKVISNVVSASHSHAVGLKSDGTVVAVGYNLKGECNVDDWRDIVAVSAGGSHTVGLKSDGTVVAVGNNNSGECNADDWKDIIAVSAGGSFGYDYDYTIGLKADGTVVAVGSNENGQCNVDGWKDIVAISAGYSHVVGLKTDGTVVAVGDNGSGQCNVDDWRDIVAVSAGDDYTVGLKTDGTVVAVGDNRYGQCVVAYWQNIVGVSAGGNATVGLKADGTIAVAGSNDVSIDGKWHFSEKDWRNVIAISADYNYIVGLKSNGTVEVIDCNFSSREDAESWKNIKTK